MKQASLKKNTIANYIGQFYSILIGIVMLPLYLQYLGAEAYGLVGFFTMFMSWMMLLDVGLSSTLARETARLKDKSAGLLKLKNLIRSIELFFLVVSVILIISIYGSSEFIVSHWLEIKELSFETVQDSIKLMGLMMVVRWFVGFYQGSIIGFEYQVWLNVYKIGINTLKFVGAFLLVKYITDDIYHFFLYQLSVGLLEYMIVRYKVYSLLPKTTFIIPSFIPLKKIAPFALSIAYTSAVWIVFTQMDKLLLSHYMPLSEYGYFTLVVVLSGAIMQLSAPISQALQPRMTSLLSNHQEKEMLVLYHKGTQVVSIVIFSVVAIVITFSCELLFAWTGDAEASKWATPILKWYVVGNGILAIGAFQYYLQYAHGNLKYHVRMNTVFPIITLPIVFYAVTNYGALGAAQAWFGIQLVGFIVWPPFVHSKFAKGHHKEWLLKDIFPSLLTTAIYSVVLYQVNIDFSIYNRVEIFLVLIGLGIVLLFANAISYRNIRSIIRDKYIKGI